MSKPTPGPDRDRPDLLRAVRRLGPWTTGKALATTSAGLVLVSVLASAVGWGRTEPALAGMSNPATSTSVAAPSTAPVSPSASTTAPAATSSAGLASRPATSATAVPTRGAGTTRVLTVPGSDSAARGRTVRYTVEVEDGAGVDEANYAHVVHDVLTDRRGWETQDNVHFVNVSPEQAAAGEHVDVRVTLASPDTVDEMCAPMDTEGQVSCNSGERVALNSLRWTQGVPYYPDDLLHYRIYLVSHEVGHAIGHDHETCAGPGRPAPVMLQQTLGLDGCTRYPWPVPGQEP